MRMFLRTGKNEDLYNMPKFFFYFGLKMLRLSQMFVARVEYYWWIIILRHVAWVSRHPFFAFIYSPVKKCDFFHQNELERARALIDSRVHWGEKLTFYRWIRNFIHFPISLLSGLAQIPPVMARLVIKVLGSIHKLLIWFIIPGSGSPQVDPSRVRGYG